MKQECRVKLLQNNQWKFMYGDFPEAKEVSFDDGEWYDIGIPHSFGIPYFMENEFYVGYGCYRKIIHMEEAWLNRKVFLEFQGVFQEAEVYLNGQLAGIHKGGYTAFEIDLTSYVVAGENQLFVRVNNRWNPRLAPRAGEHVFNGGIYRDVSLVVTSKLHVAWYGTFVTTPNVTREEADVLVETEVKNETASAVDCRVLSVIEYQGQEVGTSSTVIHMKEGEEATVHQKMKVEHPHLWHPDTPDLYLMKTCVFMGDERCDTYETVFGIRWFQFTSDQGFFLNGEHYWIEGANVHQDHAGWSDAVTHTGIHRDVKLVKDCGMNFIRGSHYPHHTVFAEECDKQGLLFWSENCFWGTGGPKVEGYWTSSAYPVEEEDEEEFEASCIRTLQEMIRTNRNHPSIIVWSMCNEPFFTASEVIHKAKQLVRRLVAASHEADPTRPAAVGGAQRGGFDELGDIAGYNGDGAFIFMNPGFPNLVSEYGSYEESNRPGNIPTEQIDMEYPWRSGKSLWCAFHHGSILWNMGYLGMIDYYRLPLNLWYWYREKLLGINRPEPVTEGIPYAVRLTADRTMVAADGTEDAFLTVEMINREGNRISNDMEIVLQIVDGDMRFPTGKQFLLSGERKNLYEGIGAIEVRSYYAGKSRIRAACKGLIPDELTIEAVQGESWTGQERKELQKAPFVSGPPVTRESYNIAMSRPVFASSEEKDNVARNVTDTNSSISWHPSSMEEGQWIMVDLEGCKPASLAQIFFEDFSRNSYEISISCDGAEFEVIADCADRAVQSCVELNLKGRSFRYFRVRFPEEPIAVNKIIIND